SIGKKERKVGSTAAQTRGHDKRTGLQASKGLKPTTCRTGIIIEQNSVAEEMVPYSTVCPRIPNSYETGIPLTLGTGMSNPNRDTEPNRSFYSLIHAPNLTWTSRTRTNVINMGYY
ncbi:hypothetical protein DPEC_G00014190, partial [Dallia pectoralis]